MSVLRVNTKRAPSGVKATVLDPPRQIPAFNGLLLADGAGWVLQHTASPDGHFEADGDGVLAVAGAGAGLRAAVFARSAVVY